jgi:hypothetical protein
MNFPSESHRYSIIMSFALFLRADAHSLHAAPAPAAAISVSPFVIRYQYTLARNESAPQLLNKSPGARYYCMQANTRSMRACERERERERERGWLSLIITAICRYITKGIARTFGIPPALTDAARTLHLGLWYFVIVHVPPGYSK